MTPIEGLEVSVRNLHPDSCTIVERPFQTDGFWTLDVRKGAAHIIVEWRQGGPFFVSSANEDGYGEGGDETFGSFQDVEQRLGELIGSSERTILPIGSLLSRARESDRLTQGQVAEKLGVTQATVSGIERRHDIQISTLRRYLAVFKDTIEVRICAEKISLSPVRRKSAGHAIMSVHRMAVGRRAFPCLSEEGKLTKANADALAISCSGSVFEFVE